MLLLTTLSTVLTYYTAGEKINKITSKVKVLKCHFIFIIFTIKFELKVGYLNKLSYEKKNFDYAIYSGIKFIVISRELIFIYDIITHPSFSANLQNVCLYRKPTFAWDSMKGSKSSASIAI